jgi:hypothetical protein
MAVNSPTQAPKSITIEDVDMTLLDLQTKHLNGVLKDRAVALTGPERLSLTGIRNLLLHIQGQAPGAGIVPTKNRRVSEYDINRARDLFMAGKTALSIAKQLGYQPLVIARLLKGQSFADVPYAPSEFAPHKLPAAGTHPWLKQEKEKGNAKA